MLVKYGHRYNSQRAEVKPILSAPKIELATHAKLSDSTWLDMEYNVKQRSLSDIAGELGVYYGTVGFYCTKYGYDIRQTTIRSTEETQLCDFLDILGIQYIVSDRTIIAPKELDIVIPTAKLAIELNGLRWHSHHPSGGKPEDRMRHISKTRRANANGYTLLHVTDYEWHHSRDIIKAMIQSRLGLNQKLHARHCAIRVVPTAESREFLNTYHIQGYIHPKYTVGLYHAESLVMMMSLGTPRYSTVADYEILRMCCAAGVTVVGGVSRLLASIKKQYPHSTFISYCDLSKGNGVGYYNAGFTKISESDPGYVWTDGNSVVSRYRAQRTHLAKWLPTFDPSLSVAVNMFNAGYRRYWDCGNAVFAT